MGASLLTCVRDRARQGRDGGAGSSVAEKPGPKGDAQPPQLTRCGPSTTVSATSALYPAMAVVTCRTPPESDKYLDSGQDFPSWTNLAFACSASKVGFAESEAKI